MQILVASRNQAKVRELRDILEADGYTPVSLGELDPGGKLEITENGLSFTENAIIKATTVAKRFNTLGLGEDSGLSVEALGDAPGIYSARYHALETESLRRAYPDYPGGRPLTATSIPADTLNNVRLLAELEGTENRSAHYTCAVALVTPEGEVLLSTVGRVEGHITNRPAGARGFGYDPLFVPAGNESTFAQQTPEAKHAVSHRGRALKKLIEFLKKEQP